ncbi:hypothetical protein TrRE_jg4196 [Triparma retinervis]|uniref:Protein kinase domain-containing protein n=1 Tax=Triparma retinervis TaxID=2557542 RepID=A0A9W7DU17_9STRA|nr:hypothetical protein TrRE_jg4196 [Triparma retinervis]
MSTSTSTSTSLASTPPLPHHHLAADTSTTSSANNLSTSSSSSIVRPMPDMSAFDCGGTTSTALRVRKDDAYPGEKGVESPMICPPTPVRTPVVKDWKGEDGEKDNEDRGGLRVRIPQWSNREDMDVGRSKVSSIHKGAGNSAASGSDNGAAAGQGWDDSDEDEMTFLTHFSKIGDLGMGTQSDVFKVRDRKGGVWAVKRNKKQFRGKKERAVVVREVEMMQHLQRGEEHCPYLLLFVKAWQEDAYFYSQTELCSRCNLRMCMDGMGAGWKRAGPRVKALTQDDGRPYPSGYLPPTSSKAKGLYLTCGGGKDGAGRLAPETAIWKVAHDVCLGLAFMHSRGVVHLDIKPANIMLQDAGGGNGVICKIGDFGMATREGEVMDGHDGDTKLAGGPLFELPSEGERWRMIRSGNGSDFVGLPPCRSQQLSATLHAMISLDPSSRPPARSTSSLPPCGAAGSKPCPLLAAVVTDYADHDRKQERRIMALERSARNRRFTPTGALLSEEMRTRQ